MGSIKAKSRITGKPKDIWNRGKKASTWQKRRSVSTALKLEEDMSFPKDFQGNNI